MTYQEGDAVTLLIDRETDLGFAALINNDVEGVLYYNEVFRPLQVGDSLQGYIKKIREDGKIDLSLHQEGYADCAEISDKILALMKRRGGRLFVGDKSSPAKIQEILGISKKKFKMAVGNLYKQDLIAVEDTSIRLRAKPTSPISSN